MANSPKNAPRLDGLITQPQPESHPRWQTVGRMKSAPIFYAGLHDRNLAVKAVYWNPQGDEDDPEPFVFVVLGRP